MCEERKKKKKNREDDKEVSRILYLRVRMQTIRRCVSAMNGEFECIGQPANARHPNYTILSDEQLIILSI